MKSDKNLVSNQIFDIIITLSIPAGALITIIFLCLQFSHIINWSWMWIFAPLWIPIICGILSAIITFLAAVISGSVRRFLNKHRKKVNTKSKLKRDIDEKKTVK